MVRKVVFVRRVGATVFSTLAALSVWGCAESFSDGPAVDATESSLVQPAWVPCARAGQYCAFTGKHNVRYGLPGQYTTRTFSGGAQCDATTFNTKRVYSATCDYDSNA